MEQVLILPNGFESWLEFFRHIESDKKIADFIKSPPNIEATIRYRYIDDESNPKEFYISVRTLKCMVFDEIIGIFPIAWEIDSKLIFDRIKGNIEATCVFDYNLTYKEK
jgi:hypothetical protein